MDSIHNDGKNDDTQQEQPQPARKNNSGADYISLQIPPATNEHAPAAPFSYHAGKINIPAMKRFCKDWIKRPMNIALLVWLVFVAAGLLSLGLLMTGMLDGEIPKSSERDRWTEIINQILNALFTIMCLYQHPRLCHHLVLLWKWTPAGAPELRKVYCKDGARRRHERSHMAFVVVLLHVTCLVQYCLCVLFWGFSTNVRPDWAVNLCFAVGTAAPAIAGVYAFFSPLGRKYETACNGSSQCHELAAAATKNHATARTVVVTQPEWVGGLFDCCDDSSIFCLSFFCTTCLFGWNLDRLGLGNTYVHIFTFLLLLIAPFFVFTVTALNINDDFTKYTVASFGAVLCFFGLLYGGFWRTKMRKRFNLPANTICCGSASLGDFIQWLFCWSCSLAQEVRTADFYDVAEGGGGPVLVLLSRESRKGSAAPLSNVSVSNSFVSAKDVSLCDIGINGSSSEVREEAMAAPVPPNIQLEEF